MPRALRGRNHFYIAAMGRHFEAGSRSYVGRQGCGVRHPSETPGRSARSNRNRLQPSEIVQTGGPAARAMMRAPAMAYNAVRGVVSPLVPRWAIIVNGKSLVAVPDRNMARR